MATVTITRPTIRNNVDTMVETALFLPPLMVIPTALFYIQKELGMGPVIFGCLTTHTIVDLTEAIAFLKSIRPLLLRPNR